MDIQGPGPSYQLSNYFSQMVGLPERVISPSQGRYLHTGQRQHRINAHIDIHAVSGIRTHEYRDQWPGITRLDVSPLTS
jgi:hypothetical protein